MITKESIMTFPEMSRVLVRDLGFMYMLPHSGLRRWISNYTITFPSGGMMSNEYAVIPHGSATLVFSCDNNRMVSDLFGPMTKPACVGQRANSFRLLFIVEFQPAGYYAFSGMPQKELVDTILPLAHINPELQKRIEQQLEAATDIQRFIGEVDRLFLAHLKTTFFQDEFFLANQMIVENSGLLSVKEIAQKVFYSERHLSRIFDHYMGLGIKSFSNLVRVNRALRLMRRPSLSLLQICQQTGFYDMPHFIHIFKGVCGITPQEYRNNMSDFYSEIAKF